MIHNIFRGALHKFEDVSQKFQDVSQKIKNHNDLITEIFNENMTFIN
uniref:Uncharacterized protein n=1 Tax=Romanomermis culicivorax TaxID=13658 RepID=A0A915HRW7_ROMCU